MTQLAKTHPKMNVPVREQSIPDISGILNGNPIFVISGPAWAGIDETADYMVKRDQGFERLIFLTTHLHEEKPLVRRWHHVSQEFFDRTKIRDEFFYIFSTEEGEERGFCKEDLRDLVRGKKHPLLVLDLDRALEFKKLFPTNLKTIFIKSTKHFLNGDHSEAKKRIAEEQEHAEKFDFRFVPTSPSLLSGKVIRELKKHL